MESIRRRHRWFAVLAALALFAMALGPSISRASTAAAGFSPANELCGSFGALRSDGLPGATPVDHCPLCGLGPALPAVAEAAPPPIPASSVVGEAQPASVQALRRVHSPPPRAPPCPAQAGAR